MCSDRGDPRLPGEPGLRVVQSGGRGQPGSLEAVRTQSTRLSVLSVALDVVCFAILFYSELMMPYGFSLCVCVSVSQPCDEGTHRD